MSEAIYSVHGSRYTNQKSIGLYPTTGSADDWFYSDDANEGNGEYRAAAYTIELRDTGSYGFLLPSSEVRKVYNMQWQEYMCPICPCFNTTHIHGMLFNIPSYQNT